MLSIENLSVEYYRHRQVIPAVRNFNFTIGAAETVGLVGESGSGKSTVALAILRLIRPQEGRITSGKIIFENEDILAWPEERMRRTRGKRISMIFQDPFTSLNPVMRIREQMAEVLNAHQDTASSIEHRLSIIDSRSAIGDSLERVQLDPHRALNAFPHQLSGGQRQRVMIAMALLTKPSLLLADEPTTALDVLVQKDILDLLFKLQKELHLSVLFISHNLALISQYAQRIAVMKQGELVEEATAQALFRTPRNPYTRQLIASLPKW